MDARFHPAMAAIKAGDVDQLRLLLKQEPSLATDCSSRSHPTLLQCAALETMDVPNRVEIAEVLIEAGAEIEEPVVAAACIDNVEVLAALLDAGGSVNGLGIWSPLEEALYWSNQRCIDLLLERGASLHNLRIAAGLGRADLIDNFFNPDGSLKPEAGKITSPFGDIRSEEVREDADKSRSNPQDIINNAFVYACMNGHIEAAEALLKKGAEIDVIPPGFDYSGTGLHYAAHNGHLPLVKFLVNQGASLDVRDTKVDQTPANWAAHGGHEEIREYLERAHSN